MPEILKVKFANLTLNEAVNKSLEILAKGKKAYIATPNPELLLIANGNEKYRQILNRSAFNTPDGTGILWAAKFQESAKRRSKSIIILKWAASLLMTALRPKYKYGVIAERVTGVDLMNEICKASTKGKYKIFLLGAGENVVEKLKKKLETKNPGINISGIYRGTPDLADEKEIIRRINTSAADILFVAFGSPKQEVWISRNLKYLKSVKLAIGVGGSFDFISGNKKRAPLWMQKTGLEWLFRLIREPKRIKRIYNATIKFPILILKKALKD
ncbi:WecB/TagA/CpsF family glycosyltransferase [Candidatus Peregrinibacteria bacterium]|nr:WecB/TagA/CpsF family glycosyltransferase [Candidatus Peregrinibacteria bacterium]